MATEKLALFGGPKAISEMIPLYNSIGEEELNAVAAIVKSGTLSAFFGSWGENFLGGPQIKAFEAEWCRAFDVPYSVTVNSATSGLIAAVGACGIGPGDEVIVSPFTMTTSASCVRVFGGTPVFADIDPDTFNLTAQSIEKSITPKTKAVIVVHLTGQPADMNEILRVTRPKNIRVIEDAAQAPGAVYGGRAIGTFGDIGVFSLNCHKTIQTGEGGVCCTHDQNLARRLQLIRNHGEAVVEEMGLTEGAGQILGFNFRMGEIEAGIGREQLKKLPTFNLSRQKIADYTGRRLSKLSGLRVPIVKADRNHVYYIYMMRLIESEAGVNRRAIVRALTAEGVPCYEGYCKPLYLQPLYRIDWPGKDGRSYQLGLCPVAERLYEQEVFFHGYLYESLWPTWIEKICGAFEKVWDNRDELKKVPLDGTYSIRRA